MEIFAWGKYGGFGRATRTIGRELAARGHEVYAVVPRRPGQKPVESLDGMTVLSFPPRRSLATASLFRSVDADIYHSCEPSTATWIASRTMPDRVHVVTCRDPRDWTDWKTEFALPSRSHFRVAANWVYENGPLVRWGVQRADAVYAAARCLAAKAQRIYGLRVPPSFLPTPIVIPASVEKAAQPTVCFVGRLDRRKRPELFFALAERFPEVRFIAVGASNDAGWDQHLRERYGRLPNLELPGFVDQFRTDELSQILDRSWVIVNTSAREGLPNSMLEAAAHRCAVLSSVDPDGFASVFGYFVEDDDFAKGLRWLLEADRWRTCGETAGRYVAETFETGRSIDLHLAAYEELGRRVTLTRDQVTLRR